MDCPSNSVKTIVDYYATKISILYQPEEAKAIVWRLMEHYFSISRLNLSMNPELRLNESEMLLFHGAYKKITQNIPLQYVIGKSDFLDLSFWVNDSVLIPRPETEQLTQIIIDQLPGDYSGTILDVGTGSGCLAITLKKYRKNSRVFAFDIDQRALETAEKNAVSNNVFVHFFLFDIFGNRETLPFCDIIVANPPYVCRSEQKSMNANVLLFEPEKALFVDDENPMIFYHAIAQTATEKLSENGMLFFEINERFGTEMLLLLKKYDFRDVQLLQDFRGKDRFVIGKRK